MGEESRHLRPDDWTNAALEAIADGGTGRVAVEALARELGAPGLDTGPLAAELGGAAGP